MAIYEREREYVKLLSAKPYTVKQLASALFISEPTVRRDINLMREKEIVECRRGVVSLKKSSPDARIPIIVRNFENVEKKEIIARKAVGYIKDGFSIMLDSSTTVYSVIPYLVRFKNILVITNGIKTADALAEMGIKTICVGGDVRLDSSACFGSDAEYVLSRYNVDVALFSCRGVSETGLVTDNSVEGNSLRKIMIKNSKNAYLLVDSSKLNKTCLNTLCTVKDLTAVISDVELDFN